MKSFSLLYQLIGSLFVAGALIALFLPFLETSTDGMQREPYRFISQYVTDDGFRTTYNGFGSAFGCFNAVLSLLMLVPLFAGRPVILLRIGLGLYIASQVLMIAGLLAAPFMLSPYDRLLAGYFVLSICETGLFICFFRSRRKERESDENIDDSDELLDRI